MKNIIYFSETKPTESPLAELSKKFDFLSDKELNKSLGAKDIKEIRYKEISETDLKETKPDVYNYMQKMHERLDNNCPDGIMNTLHYYEGDDGSILIKSDDPQFANSHIRIKGNP